MFEPTSDSLSAKTFKYFETSKTNDFVKQRIGKVAYIQVLENFVILFYVIIEVQSRHHVYCNDLINNIDDSDRGIGSKFDRLFKELTRATLHTPSVNAHTAGIAANPNIIIFELREFTLTIEYFCDDRGTCFPTKLAVRG